MHSRFILINFPGLGVGDVRNSSSSNHSVEQLLKYGYDKQLNLDFSGLESIGFDAFVKYSGSQPRKTSVTARLASKSIHGNNDFSAFNELGGGDERTLPVFSQFASGQEELADSDVFVISIGSDESIVPSFEFLHAQSDEEVSTQLMDVIEAPLVRNEFIVANYIDFREACLEANPTFALACLAQLSKLVSEILPKLGSSDGLMVISTTAIDATSQKPQFRNELTPMMYHTPMGQIHDLGLRLLSDIGPSIAEFFDLNRKSLVGASMGKWMNVSENPQDSASSPIHS
jgi:phosphopentomutase